MFDAATNAFSIHGAKAEDCATLPLPLPPDTRACIIIIIIIIIIICALSYPRALPPTLPRPQRVARHRVRAKLVRRDFCHVCSNCERSLRAEEKDEEDGKEKAAPLTRFVVAAHDGLHEQTLSTFIKHAVR